MVMMVLTMIVTMVMMKMIMKSVMMMVMMVKVMIVVVVRLVAPAMWLQLTLFSIPQHRYGQQMPITSRALNSPSTCT